MSLSHFKAIRTRELPKYACPNCTRILDGITGVADCEENTIPTLGVVTVCGYCGVLLVIERMGFSFAPPERLQELDADVRDLIASAIGKTIWIGPSTSR